MIEGRRRFGGHKNWQPLSTDLGQMNRGCLVWMVKTGPVCYSLMLAGESGVKDQPLTAPTVMPWTKNRWKNG
jgi:hypothetical protein